MNYQQWSISNMSISTVPLRAFQWLSSFLALPWRASRWTVQWPPGAIWLDVLTSTRSQVVEVLWSGNCLTPVSWELYYRDGLFTPAELLKCLTIIWSIGPTSWQYLSFRIQVLWLGFDWDNPQTVNIGHSMRYVIGYISQSTPLWMTAVFVYPGTKILACTSRTGSSLRRITEHLLKYTREDGNILVCQYPPGTDT